MEKRGQFADASMSLHNLNMDTNCIDNLVKKHEAANSIMEIISFIFEPAAGAGEGYTSLIQRAKLRVQLTNGRRTEKFCIIKSSPEESIERKFMDRYNLMKNEINMYEDNFKGMEILMEQCGDKKEKVWCDMIGYRPFDMLILEDLKQKEYKMINRVDCLDYEHIMLSVSTLGRFHAISKVYFSRGENKKKTDHLRYYCLLDDDVLLDMFLTGGLTIMSEVVKESWGPEWKDIADKIHQKATNIKESVQEIMRSRQEEMDVLNHGDLWCCNIMFKYHDFKNVPIHAKFIDFQMPHFNSLAWDLVVLIYTSVRAPQRRQYYSEILDHYFTAFSSTLDAYKFDGPRPTRESIEEELKVFKYVGMLILCSTYTMTITEGEVFSMEPFLQSEGPYRCYHPQAFNNKRYKDDIAEDLIEFVNEGIL